MAWVAADQLPTESAIARSLDPTSAAIVPMVVAPSATTSTGTGVGSARP